MTSRTPRRASVPGATVRWLVHLGLVGTTIVSLVFEPLILTIHIVLGLAFAVLAVAHLVQRRRVSARLLARLSRPGRTLAGRLALADALLAAMTAGMLASGFWDWSAGHPTRIRWQAISGIVLTVLLAVHTVRRRSRLRRSKVR